MTDEELINELRESSYFQGSLEELAADRIEKLLESIKNLSDLWATVAVNREVSEGKLAKAVGALRYYAEKEDYEEQLIVRDCGCCSYSEDPIILDDKGKLARAVLAELEKTE